jgi:hypothetical protein
MMWEAPVLPSFFVPLRSSGARPCRHDGLCKGTRINRVQAPAGRCETRSAAAGISGQAALGAYCLRPAGAGRACGLWPALRAPDNVGAVEATIAARGQGVTRAARNGARAVRAGKRPRAEWCYRPGEALRHRTDGDPAPVPSR